MVQTFVEDPDLDIIIEVEIAIPLFFSRLITTTARKVTRSPKTCFDDGPYRLTSHAPRVCEGYGSTNAYNIE
jgi:hypothetical protein